jgi:hypothetical protein
MLCHSHDGRQRARKPEIARIKLEPSMPFVTSTPPFLEADLS